ncbi:MAG: hypothetical protein J5I92_00975 [Thiogranum sp.]|nr:hypothetical protein [Thiogranum sp.]
MTRRFLIAGWSIAAPALVAAWLLSQPGLPAAAMTGPAESQWLNQTAGLIEAARTRAPVGEFRERVIAQREWLRDIVRAGQGRDELRALHVNLVLLQTLLQSAADCHQAGRILCPPDLMRQLEAQLARARSGLTILEN